MSPSISRKCLPFQSLISDLPQLLLPCGSNIDHRLVKVPTCTNLSDNVDHLQTAYSQTKSMEHYFLALHSALDYFDNNNSHVRILFIDYCSAFKTIISNKLFPKFQDLDLGAFICSWLLDFLTSRLQFNIGHNISSILILNIGAAQGLVLSPLLYSMHTHDCFVS